MWLFDFLKTNNKTELLAKEFKETCLSLNIDISENNEIDLFNEWDLILDYYNATDWGFNDIMQIMSEKPIVWFINHLVDSFFAQRYELFTKFVYDLESNKVLPERYSISEVSVWDVMNAKDTIFFIYLYSYWEKNINKNKKLTKKDIEENIKIIWDVFWY